MDEENEIISSTSEDKDNEIKKIDEKVRSKSLTKPGGSKFKKYCDFFVGKRGFFAFLKYEIITGLFASCPGAAGIFLRGIFYRFLLKKVGKGVSFGKNIMFRHPNKIIIGNNVVIDDNCMLDAKGNTNGGIVIEDGVFLGRNTILSCKDGDIILRENVNLGFNCDIFSGKKIEIGKDTMIAAYTYFVAGNYVYDSADKPATEMDTICKGIYVGENCWFGAKALIFDGVTIGRNSIIGGAAVVNEDIPEYSVAVGMPAKVVKSRK